MSTRKKAVETHEEVFTIDSREVADMVKKRHSDLLETIGVYIMHLENGKFRSPDYFIESSYKSEQNKTMPCYLIARKGCDMIAHKMTGGKGVQFTAAYIDRFYEMERELAKPVVAKRRPKSEEAMELHRQIVEVVEYLNYRTGKRYRPDNVNTRRLIAARLSEGYTVDDFRCVIDTKVNQWNKPPVNGRADMRIYLRPVTLFSNHFEDYLNEPVDYVFQLAPAEMYYCGKGE